MKILGLIVEYNPFHNGHLYHLQKSIEKTKATHTIAIMSGNFLQRGEPALFDKYTRAHAAVKNGVDLVIELPTMFACQSAEIFSHGAITTLNSLNCVDAICFGSEEGDVDILYTISKILVDEPEEFKISLKKYLSDGMLFPTARSLALFDYINDFKLLDISKEKLLNILNSSNNILGLEYIKSIIDIFSGIFDVFVSIIVSVYILLQRTTIINALRRFVRAIFKKETYETIDKYFTKANQVFFTFISSQLLDAVIVGILTTIAMMILKVKYAPLIGFTIGLFNMIPYIGAIVAVSIGILVTFITGGFGKALAMAVVVIILQQIDANIINPKIIGSSLEISPLLVIFSITVGGAYFGILGMFLAVPIAVVLKIGLTDFVDARNKIKDEEESRNEG